MSDADGADSKVGPLRVPVLDVPVRNSILAPEAEPSFSPLTMEGEQRPSVIPQPVRFVSGPPSANGRTEDSSSEAVGGPPEPASEAPTPSEPPLELSTMDGADAGEPEAPPEEIEVERSVTTAATSYSDRVPPPDPLPSIDPAETLEIDPDEDDDAEPIEVPRASLAQPPPTPAKAAVTVSSGPPPPPPAAARTSRAPVDIQATDEEEDSAVVIDLNQDDDSAPEPAAATAVPAVGEEQPPPAGRGTSQAPPPPPPASRGPEGAAAHRVADLKPSKPRKQHWWESFFNDDYLRSVRVPGREAVARKADFVEKRLGLSPGATVLDVGCGWGADVVELSPRGYLGVGLDLSLAMLSRAADEAQERGQRINFLHADMREMNFDGTFDAVMCLGTTFGYFDDDTNRQVISRLRRALKPQGVLLLETVNRDHVIRSQPNLIWFEGDGCVCMEESEFNYFTSRLHVKRTAILDDGRQRENEYSVRLYSLHEIGQMLHQQGFRVTEVSGRLAVPGVFFGQESPGLLVVAERRADGTGKFSIPPLEEAFEEDDD